jgi:hypothetical protein
MGAEPKKPNESPIAAPSSHQTVGAVVALSGRPQKVTDLLWNPEVADGEGWFTENIKKKRFFVIGVADVMATLGVSAHNSMSYFTNAERIVATETAWKTQHNFNYECSNVQLRDKALYGPRSFGKSATLIVAMEAAAREREPDYNVYANLRILSAHYFVDHFDEERLNKLRAIYEGWNDTERAERFPDGHELTFDKTCAVAIGQWSNPCPLNDMSVGHCATELVCNKLISFIKDHYLPELHVGPTRKAGDDKRSDSKLGTKHASDRLRVPRSLSKLGKETGKET